MSYSQTTTKIEFSGTKKQVRETKKALNKYDIYLMLPDKEIKIVYTADSLLIVEKITANQIEQIKSKEFVLIKFRSNKSCFYSLFPNGFFVYNSIQNFMIYKSSKEDNRYALNFSYTSNGMSLSTPLSLIPCSEYNGEYDNGLEKYSKSIEKE